MRVGAFTKITLSVFLPHEAKSTSRVHGSCEKAFNAVNFKRISAEFIKISNQVAYDLKMSACVGGISLQIP